MKTETLSETEDGFRLRKADEFLKHCRAVENNIRIDLSKAIEQTKRAKEKYDSLFIECEKHAYNQMRGERGKQNLTP